MSEYCKNCKKLQDRLDELRVVCDLIADDSYAMTFQTVGQYRTALLRRFEFDKAQNALMEGRR